MQRPTTGKLEAESLNCSVLVVSCDSYRDLWQPFFQLFARHWPDCPFPVYLGSNFATLEQEGVAAVHAGQDTSWSASLRLFLEQVPSEYVLLLLEDFFLDKKVDSAAVKDHLKVLHDLKGTMMRVFPNPPPDYALSGRANVGVTHPMAPYRVSLQAAIWNKAKLLSIVRDGESAWQFEWNGTERSRTEDGYYCVQQALVHYQHVVERGEWFWTAARRYRRELIGCDMTARPVMNPGRALRKMIFNAGRRLGTRCQSKWLYLRG